MEDEEEDGDFGRVETRKVPTAAPPTEQPAAKRPAAAPPSLAAVTFTKRLKPSVPSAMAAAAPKQKRTHEELLHQIFSDDEDEAANDDAREADALQKRELLKRGLPRRLATDVTGACIPVTSASSGARVYCSKDVLQFTAAAGVDVASGPAIERWDFALASTGEGSLLKPMLPKPVSEMLRELDDERIAQVGGQGESWRCSYAETIFGHDGAQVSWGNRWCRAFAKAQKLCVTLSDIGRVREGYRCPSNGYRRDG